MKAIREATPQALPPLHPLRPGEPACFEASEADPDLGFMARTDGAVLPAPHQPRQPASLQATVNGPYKLIMISGGRHQTPLSAISHDYCWPGYRTEAVRTQSRELVLGKSLSEFMRTLGMEPVGGGATGARKPASATRCGGSSALMSG